MYIFNIYIWDCNMFAKKEKYHHLKGDRELILHTNQQTSAFIIIYIERYITNTHTHTYIYIYTYVRSLSWVSQHSFVG